MSGYRIFLSEESWQFLEREEVDRSTFSGVLRSLSEDGDFQETNPVDGRILTIKIVGDYAITYFFDHAVKEIKVLHIEQADG